jgi:hypothetical protein
VYLHKEVSLNELLVGAQTEVLAELMHCLPKDCRLEDETAELLNHQREMLEHFQVDKVQADWFPWPIENKTQVVVSTVSFQFKAGEVLGQERDAQPPRTFSLMLL